MPSTKEMRFIIMKLDINCVRDTLITLESWLVLNDNLEFLCLGLDEINKSSEMLKYTKPEVAYTLVLLKEAGFIEARVDYSSGRIYELDVIRLTFSGHQFLDTIRPQSTWNKIHELSEKTGLKSISAIMEIADIILPETIRSVLHSQ